MAEAKARKRWSYREKIAFGILLSLLGVSLVLLGIVLSEPPIGPGLCGAFGATPCPGTEALAMYSSTTNSPTNITIVIVNSGSAAMTFVSYYVKDPSSKLYSNNNWSGPTLAPSEVISINVLVDGHAFTFQRGTYYSITLISARNNQFTLTVQA